LDTIKAAPARTAAMPLIWCAATAAIIASGLVVPLSGGVSAGFGGVFELGHGQDFRQGLALYGVGAAVLGAAFMFAPRRAGWRLHNGLAWTTFMLMVVGGILMLIVPQALVALAEGGGEKATALAQMWSAAWFEAGSKISFAGAIVGAATFLDAWIRRKV
jgi:hypothetical protein